MDGIKEIEKAPAKAVARDDCQQAGGGIHQLEVGRVGRGNANRRVDDLVEDEQAFCPSSAAPAQRMPQRTVS